jgi:hypothetical protein
MGLSSNNGHEMSKGRECGGKSTKCVRESNHSFLDQKTNTNSTYPGSSCAYKSNKEHVQWKSGHGWPRPGRLACPHDHEIKQAQSSCCWCQPRQCRQDEGRDVDILEDGVVMLFSAGDGCIVEVTTRPLVHPDEHRWSAPRRVGWWTS